MSRFESLYQHFEQSVGKMLNVLPDVDRSQLVFAYRDGVYRVYESQDKPARSAKAVEINPAASLTSMREVWFFQDTDGLAAYVEYQPDYRPRVLISDPHMPFIQFQAKDRPTVPGFH